MAGCAWEDNKRADGKKAVSITMNKKRVAIYVFYDKNGIVDRYVTYMLQEVLKICCKLIVVCNGELSGKGQKALCELTEDVIIREDEGFDPWGHKAGIEWLRWDNLYRYDELILLNDSIFGPFYPLKAMFDEMDGKNLDFWGITKQGPSFDPYGLTKEGIFPGHISLYFYVVGNKMLSHPEFKLYWDRLPALNSRAKAISLHEVQFTRHFSERGFTWAVYINEGGVLEEYTDISLVHLMIFELIKDYNCPFMKRRNFSEDYKAYFGYTIGDSTKKAFDYIEKYTEYDTDLIWENILRTMNLKNIKDNLHLNYILPRNYVQDNEIKLGDIKVALLAHITYADQVEFCANYASAIVEHADIYITTSTEYMKSVIFEHFGKICCNNLKIIVLPQERNGRDVSALWVALKPYMVDYDYICFIHDKKSAHIKPLTIGRGFAQKCLENTLASKEYVINILGMFQRNHRLGMLLPPTVIHGSFQFSISHQWSSDYNNVVKLSKKLDIDVPMDDKDLVFPAGAIFWFRPKALKKLIEHDWKYSDFPGEPLPVHGSLGHAFERIYCFAAQSEGYYSAWVMSDYSAPAEITSLNYLLLTRAQAGPAEVLKIHLKNRIKRKLLRNPKLLSLVRRFYRLMKKERRHS